MRKYIAIIDHRAATGKGFTFVELSARSLSGAQTQANALFSCDPYLIGIAEKSAEIKVDGMAEATYKEVSQNRGQGWKQYTNNNNFIVKGYYSRKTGTFFEYALER